MRPLHAAAVAVLLAGCAEKPVDTCPPGEPCWLTLQSWAAVDEQGLSGYLRWAYVSDDPGTHEEPELVCEVWELLDLEPAEAGCAGCTVGYAGVAVVDAGASDCPELSWQDRAFAYGFGPLSEAEPEWAALTEDGFTHLVHSSWSPDSGEGDFAPLFAAEPEGWTGEDAEPGSSDGASPAGEYALLPLAYWDRTGGE